MNAAQDRPPSRGRRGWGGMQQLQSAFGVFALLGIA
jgi:hypothetical protein